MPATQVGDFGGEFTIGDTAIVFQLNGRPGAWYLRNTGSHNLTVSWSNTAPTQTQPVALAVSSWSADGSWTCRSPVAALPFTFQAQDMLAARPAQCSLSERLRTDASNPDRRHWRRVYRWRFRRQLPTHVVTARCVVHPQHRRGRLRGRLDERSRTKALTTHRHQLGFSTHGSGILDMPIPEGCALFSMQDAV